MLREHEDVDFVVLYGSRARGTHKKHSDYDLLIGLQHDDSRRFMDRILDYMPFEFPLVEPKVYPPRELEELWLHFARTLLDPLYEGIVLVDHGGWSEFQEKYREATASGLIRREGSAWVWDWLREPDDSPRRRHPEFPSRAPTGRLP